MVTASASSLLAQQAGAQDRATDITALMNAIAADALKHGGCPGFAVGIYLKGQPLLAMPALFLPVRQADHEGRAVGGVGYRMNPAAMGIDDFA